MRENVALAAERGGDSGDVERLLQELDLSALSDRPAGQLSVGEGKRLELARVLALEPALLLLDEPLAGLSPAAAERVSGLIERQRGEGAAVVWVEHGPAAGDLREPAARPRGRASPFPRVARRLGGDARGAVVTARLVARELAGGYPGVTVFSKASFSVESGEILTVLGANGSGKSALLETLQGLLANRGGAVLLDGESVQDLAPEGPRGTRDESGLRPAPALQGHDGRRASSVSVRFAPRLGEAGAAARSKFAGLFTGLTRHRGARPAGLSGGLQQQLALARFAMSSPRVWLLDDPLQGLDEEMTGRVLDWIRAAAGAGAAVMLTGQHVRALLGVATKAMFLEGGSLSAIPAGAEGLSDPRVSQLL